MRRRALEITSLLAILAAIAAAVLVPLRLESARTAGDGTAVREIVLTAVMGPGVWTEEPVTAANAGRDFPPARAVLRVGETVRLRLRSADVVHSFSLPELGVDPVEVYPGRETVVTVTPEREGVFGYYCTTVCGATHFAMRGAVTVVGPEGVPPTGAGTAAAAERPPAYWKTPQPGAGASLVERGAWHFRHEGCITCHGAGGRGGVANPNGMNPTVPALDGTASKLLLFAPEDVEAFARLLESGEPLATAEAPEIPLFDAVRGQYRTFRDVIRDGRRSVRMDPAGPEPPLHMPSWRHHLTGEEIDAILAYLTSLQHTPESGRPGGRAGDRAVPRPAGRPAP